MYVCMYVCIVRAGVQPTLDPYAEALSFDLFCVKIRAGVLAVGWTKNPQNSRVNNLVLEVARARKQNPLSDLDNNFAGWQVSPTKPLT